MTGRSAVPIQRILDGEVGGKWESRASQEGRIQGEVKRDLPKTYLFIEG
jgi:hypothetical protein